MHAANETDANDSAALGAQIQSMLGAHQAMTLATAGPEGPWAATVFYAHAGWDLFWFSAPQARHSRDLGADPRLAAAIQRDDQAWESIQGLQLEGEAQLLGPALASGSTAAFAALSAKFPFLKNAAAQSGPLAAALAKTHCWRFHPRAIHLVDNTRGFGKRSTFIVPQR